MRKFLVFDTENSGLFDYAAPADADGQPRLAEFAGSILEEDDEGRLLVGIDGAYHFIVRPDGWAMTPEATAIHGMTTEFLLEHGKPIGELLDWYVARVREGCIMVTFNARHDLKQMRAELRRAGREDDFESTLNTCLMRSSWRKEIGMTKADGSRRGFPKLSDACRHFGIELNDDHRALTGLEGACRVFARLHDIGMLLEPEVHYAKDRPMPPAQGTFNEMDF
jgi:DNA polymerase III epsilon subunit-like protein